MRFEKQNTPNIKLDSIKERLKLMGRENAIRYAVKKWGYSWSAGARVVDSLNKGDVKI